MSKVTGSPNCILRAKGQAIKSLDLTYWSGGSIQATKWVTLSFVSQLLSQVSSKNQTRPNTSRRGKLCLNNGTIDLTCGPEIASTKVFISILVTPCVAMTDWGISQNEELQVGNVVWMRTEKLGTGPFLHLDQGHVNQRGALMTHSEGTCQFLFPSS